MFGNEIVMVQRWSYSEFDVPVIVANTPVIVAELRKWLKNSWICQGGNVLPYAFLEFCTKPLGDKPYSSVKTWEKYFGVLKPTS